VPPRPPVRRPVDDADAGGPANATTPKALAGSAAKAFKYIGEHPGAYGKEIASAINVNRNYFRRDIVPLLREHGVFNDGRGYYCKVSR
jgi:hypothetical protein